MTGVGGDKCSEDNIGKGEVIGCKVGTGMNQPVA